MKFLKPTTDEWLRKYYALIFKPIIEDYKDPFVYAVKMAGKGSMIRFFRFHKYAEEYRKLYSDFILYYTKVESLNEVAFWMDLSKEMDLDISENISEMFINIRRKLQYQTRSQEIRVVIVLDQLLEWSFFSSDFLDKLRELNRVNDNKIHFIVTVNACVNYKKELGLVRKCGVFHFEQIWFPMYDYDEIKYQILKDRDRKGLVEEIDNIETFCKRIWELSGGLGGIVTKLAVLSMDDLQGSLKDILSNEEVFLQVLIALSDIKTTLIKKLKNYEYDEDLFKAGLIDEMGKVKSSLVDYFLKNFNEKVLRLKGFDVNSILTSSEASVYTLLSDRKRKIVDREDIAKSLWGEDFANKYSDWAIDSIIKRIRSKVPGTEIYAVKGQGFYLEN